MGQIMNFTYAQGATPLSADEIYNLLPKHLTTQKELNEWEQFNIVKGMNWAFARKRKDIFSIEFAKKLHTKMFDKTWSWAGNFRKRQTNIGIEAIYIPQELKIIFDDVKFWLENDIYNLREIAIRLHHRLVLIHPFPNGNGRFSRLFADLMLHHKNKPAFSWGQCRLEEDSILRKKYISALQEADKGEYKKLIEFADS
jgi:Fic-DOC domain mobile mystery protein B